MRRPISVILLAAVLLAVVPVAMGVVRGLPWSQGEAASSTLTCSVKSSCAGPGEVAVFRMSSLTNAHAETAAGTTYGNIVCCSGVTGLSASCALSHTTVLRLWAATNAHVARASETSYTTKACLSAPSTTITCQYGSSCDAGAGYVCLATMSGAGVTNAHVADCASAYSTKVCCAAGAAPAVGGIAELPDLAGTSAEEAGASTEGSGWSAGDYAALAGGLAAAAFAIAVGGWYARRRRLKA
jgi:hypothetical protein